MRIKGIILSMFCYAIHSSITAAITFSFLRLFQNTESAFWKICPPPSTGLHISLPVLFTVVWQMRRPKPHRQSKSGLSKEISQKKSSTPGPTFFFAWRGKASGKNGAGAFDASCIITDVSRSDLHKLWHTGTVRGYWKLLGLKHFKTTVKRAENGIAEHNKFCVIKMTFFYQASLHKIWMEDNKSSVFLIIRPQHSSVYPWRRVKITALTS